MASPSNYDLLLKIEELEVRLAESEQLIDAIKSGEVDAFSLNKNNNGPEVYTLQSGDYAYRTLIENFNEGALNLSEHGLIVYTNSYFSTLLKLSYEKVIGNSIFDFIHADSKEDFTTLFEAGLTGKSKGEVNLWDGTNVIPVYMSFTSLHPTLDTVGIIITDLTDKKNRERLIKETNRQLADKNQQLEQTNAELASFSFVASHDLQEPLRKIQTFSNRILELGEREFSPEIKNYFARILSASSRMKNLISDLLNYSRMNTSELMSESVDLTGIALEAKNNLEETIKETNTVIEIGPLPRVEVIPHQFGQLFNNIFSNAIKYRRPGINPRIKISASIVDSSELQGPMNGAGGKYHKIAIADNGIGFDPVHEARIFELFQRLHGVNQYEGTGIGLAICKKIMQNHKGSIRANGVPGEGAVFTLFLPVHQHEA